jgi:O-antigen biosynthesis protein WbqV
MIDPLTHDEQERLLARPIVPFLTDDDRRMYDGRRCVITGAGGSVGGELARQIAACRPEQLVLIDHHEHGLFCIEQELRDLQPALSLKAVLSDVTRGAAVRRTMGQVRPDVVFHAAAYKHVTMAERAVCSSARANVLGTVEVLAALRDTGVRFVLISTDKAASPRSVMGATKQLAEQLTVAHAGQGFTPLVVRFGNVLASSGNFVEVMRERIRRGQSLVLTDPNATRYFMTLTEATSLVIKASILGDGGEVYWLDMGAQVRMGDLAERLLDVAVARGHARVPVEVIGLRPGEKLVEQLTSDAVEAQLTMHPRIHMARPARPSLSTCESVVRALRRHIDQEDAWGALKLLAGAVPDFEPSVHAWASARAAGAGPADLVAATARTA